MTVKRKKGKPTREEMAVEVSRLVDNRGEATFDALKKVSDKYRLDEKQTRDLEREYLKIPIKTKT